MMRSLSIAATGMKAQEAKLEQTAADMANMGTTAYKRGRTEFQDLIYQTVKEAGGEAGNQSPVGIQVGSGVRVGAQYSLHEQGAIKITNGMMDVAISGDGFFPIQLPNGTVAYTRDGSFKPDSQGKIVTSGGYALIPNIQIPQGSTGMTITGTGEVRVTSAEGTESVIGQLQLVSFLNPGALKKIGENIVIASTASGPPVQGTPGEAGLGNVQQGALEGSNVNPTEAVMDMISTQRTFEANSRVMSIGDQMWSLTNNIGK